jgi:MSHA biogenesis protein MshO
MRKGGQQSGFTLVELVMVIVILGIVAGALVPIISQFTNAFVDTNARSELTARGRLALERLSKDIRRVVPNTVVELTSGGDPGIGFVTSKAGGRYMSRKDSFDSDDYSIADRFRKNANLTSLFILGTAYDNFVNTDRLVIYNESATGASGIANRSALISNVADQHPGSSGTDHVQLLSFASTRWTVEPDGQHFQIADFCNELGQNGQALYWHRTTDLGCVDSTASWTTSDPILVSADTLIVEFSYLPTSLTSNAILKVTLTLTEDGETVTVAQEMHVRNTP